MEGEQQIPVLLFVQIDCKHNILSYFLSFIVNFLIKLIDKVVLMHKFEHFEQQMVAMRTETVVEQHKHILGF